MWGWAVVAVAAADETRITSPDGPWGTLRIHDTNLPVELVADDRYFAELLRQGPGAYDVEESTDDGVHRLEVRVGARVRGWTLRVHVPDGLAVEVRDQAGAVTAEGVFVALRAADVAGPITASGLASFDGRDLAGAVEVVGVRGDVLLRDVAGPMAVRDVGGTVTVQDAVGALDVRAVGELVTEHVVGRVTTDADAHPAAAEPPPPPPPRAVLRPRG